jgi:hypothetical protein
MANPWFRLYAEFLSDPKVQSMSEIMQRRLVMLFCLQCGNELETLHDEEIAVALRISLDDVTEMKQIFVSKRFINVSSSGWKIINWNKRQFKSDTSTERVKKYRDKVKQECNATETLPKRPQIQITDTDKERKKTPQAARNRYGSEKNVLLSEKEYASLLADLGAPLLSSCIEELSTAKAMKGYKYKRDDLAIRKWVVDAVKNKGGRPSSGPPPKVFERSTNLEMGA